MSYEAQVAYYNYLNHKNFIYIICKERFVNNQMVFYFQRNHFIADKIGEKIEWLREFGITNYLIERYVDLKFLVAPPVKGKTEPLTFYDLKGIFIVWLCGIIVSWVVLILEILFKKLNIGIF